MSRHISRRAPKRNGGFSWGRFPTTDGDFITWRLFRRDHRGSLHMSVLTFTARDERSLIARRVRAACHRLRDQVDEIDLAALYAAEDQAA